MVTKLKLNPPKSKTIWPGSYFRPGLEVRLRLQRFSLVVLKILNAIPLPVIRKNYNPRQEDILPKDFGRVCITNHPICTNKTMDFVIQSFSRIFKLRTHLKRGIVLHTVLHNNIILSFDNLWHFKGQ